MVKCFKLLPLFVALCPLLLNAVEILPTITDPELADRREKAFEDWIPVAESQARFDQLVKKEHQFPILSERKDGKVRDIYLDKPDGFSFWSWASMDEQELLAKERTYSQEGYVLVSLVPHAGPTGETRYWGTWVNAGSLRDVQRQLRRFGLSQARIKE